MKADVRGDRVARGSLTDVSEGGDGGEDESGTEDRLERSSGGWAAAVKEVRAKASALEAANATARQTGEAAAAAANAAAAAARGPGAVPAAMAAAALAADAAAAAAAASAVAAVAAADAVRHAQDVVRAAASGAASAFAPAAAHLAQAASAAARTVFATIQSTDPAGVAGIAAMALGPVPSLMGAPPSSLMGPSPSLMGPTSSLMGVPSLTGASLNGPLPSLPELAERHAPTLQRPPTNSGTLPYRCSPVARVPVSKNRDGPLSLHWNLSPGNLEDLIMVPSLYCWNKRIRGFDPPLPPELAERHAATLQRPPTSSGTLPYRCSTVARVPVSKNRDGPLSLHWNLSPGNLDLDLGTWEPGNLDLDLVTFLWEQQIPAISTPSPPPYPPSAGCACLHLQTPLSLLTSLQSIINNKIC
jgi:hypothetical protein